MKSQNTNQAPNQNRPTQNDEKKKIEKNEELLRIKTGYNQHTSPFQRYATTPQRQ
jgi:hypothetical protein